MKAEKGHRCTLALEKEYLHIPKGSLCRAAISEPVYSSPGGEAVVTK